MAFDGITIANVVKEMNDSIIGCRIYKIAQPEADELILTIKGSCGQKRLFISADASLPLIYFTENNKPSPLTAPGFCMLLRKHLQNGRIVAVTQPGLERIIHIDIEHLDEMGDLCRKKLIVEIMGKHSNIIFCQENGIKSATSERTTTIFPAMYCRGIQSKAVSPSFKPKNEQVRRALARIRSFSTSRGLGVPVEPEVCTHSVGSSLCHSQRKASRS